MRQTNHWCSLLNSFHVLPGVYVSTVGTMQPSVVQALLPLCILHARGVVLSWSWKNTCGENINLRFQMAVYSIGGHYMHGQRFLASMNLPPPVSTCRSIQYKERIHTATKKVAVQCMTKSASELHASLPDECDKVTVSCDGTWQRRGFASKNGVATVLSVNPDGPAKLFDVDVVSNHCDACSKSRKKLNDERFAAWYDQQVVRAKWSQRVCFVCLEDRKSSTSSNTVGILGMGTRRVSRVGLARGFSQFCRRRPRFRSGNRWSSRGHRSIIAIRGALGTLCTAASPARSSACRVEWRVVRGIPAPDSMGTSRLRHRPRSLWGLPCGYRPAHPV